MAWTYNTPEGIPNDGPKLTAIATVFTTLSFMILLLRFYVRGMMIKAIGSGEYPAPFWNLLVGKKDVRMHDG